MQTVLIVVHLFIVLALIVTVLLQRSEGGLGLGGGGGGGGVSGFMTGRGQANALTRATAILAALFFATSITLAIMAHHSAGPRSILDGEGNAQPTAQQPSADNLADTLRKQGGSPADGAPAPQNPAPPATPAAPQSR
jgi:preprotein translocase subunit SecG